MAQTMYDADGAGLAAPQVGVLRQRCVVIDVGEGLHGTGQSRNRLEHAGSEVRPEGCLSIPGRRGTVERPEKVRVRAQDRNGQPIEMEGEGFLAMALCHEIDHLDGMIYIDKMIEDVTDRRDTKTEDEE